MSFRNTIVRTGGMRMLPAIWALLLVAGACSDDKTDVVHRATDGDSVPTMMTRDRKSVV